MGVPDIRELRENLSPLVQGLDNAERRSGLVACNVVVDAAQPTLRLCGPNYFRQDSIRRPISSCEMVRPASESASPCSTIAAKASSRTSSSNEMSSGFLNQANGLLFDRAHDVIVLLALVRRRRG